MPRRWEVRCLFNIRGYSCLNHASSWDEERKEIFLNWMEPRYQWRQPTRRQGPPSESRGLSLSLFLIFILSDITIDHAWSRRRKKRSLLELDMEPRYQWRQLLSLSLSLSFFFSFFFILSFLTYARSLKSKSLVEPFVKRGTNLHPSPPGWRRGTTYSERIKCRILYPLLSIGKQRNWVGGGGRKRRSRFQGPTQGSDEVYYKLRIE